MQEFVLAGIGRSTCDDSETVVQPQVARAAAFAEALEEHVRAGIRLFEQQQVL